MITDILKIGSKILDQIFPNKEQAQEAKLKLLELEQLGTFKEIDAELERDRIDRDILVKQSDINNTEAKSDSLFKSGWRPFIGWVCGFGFIYEFPIRHILNAILTKYSFNFTSLNTAELISLTFGLLGLATVRGIEKMNRNRLK